MFLWTVVVIQRPVNILSLTEYPLIRSIIDLYQILAPFDAGRVLQYFKHKWPTMIALQVIAASASNHAQDDPFLTERGQPSPNVERLIPRASVPREGGSRA